jgi:phage-related protein (TIGR01555 family)
MSEMYGQVEYYNITPIVGTPFRVHRSRLMIYEGEPTPDDRRIQNQGWGESALQACYSHLRSFGQSFNSVDAILKAFVQDVIKMEGLMNLVASGKEDLIRKRLNLLDLSRSVLNAKLLDTKEGYEKVASSVTGIPEVLDRLAQALAAARGIPLTRLMGVSPGGLNATGDGETRQWYDQVSSYQENRVKPELERLIRYMFLAKETGYGSVPEGWAITFNSLWQQSDKETVETRKVQAETDQIYLDAGILTPEEIRESRFKDGVWSMGYDDVEGELPEAEEPETDPVTDPVAE